MNIYGLKVVESSLEAIDFPCLSIFKDQITGHLILIDKIYHPRPV